MHSHRLIQTTPAEAWLETRTEYEGRLKRVVADINANLDVESLCHGLPKRLDNLIASGGGRLKE